MPREASRECQPRLGRSAQRLVRRKSTRQERRRDCTANGPYPGAFALYIGRGSPVPRGLGRVGSSSRLASPERGSMSPLLIRRGYPALDDRSRSLLSVVEGPPTRRMRVRCLRLGKPLSSLGVSVAAGGHPQLRIQDPSVTAHELLETIGRLLAGGMAGVGPHSGPAPLPSGVSRAGSNRPDGGGVSPEAESVLSRVVSGGGGGVQISLQLAPVRVVHPKAGPVRPPWSGALTGWL